ncbi:hypothetical protein, partial [Pseudomonas sp. Root562]|uniref:hypothetical protein n=1 Tax=Pseudomonas sp. Root562 TaxID=1736561 RepID=UPI001F15812C
SVVKERLVKRFAQPRRAFYSSLICCQVVIFRSFQGILNNFNHLRCRSLASGRRILQRYTLLSTPLFQLPSGFDDLKQPTAEKLRNSLFTKEFSVSTAPEVGRIIGF